MASDTAVPMHDARVAQVVMPQMGESLSEGTIVRWLKAVGDRIGHDEPLFELSTDKVDTDVPAPAAGVLSAILVNEGETVTVGTAVALIETDAAASTAPAASAPPVSAPATAPASAAPAAAAEESGGHFKSSHAPQLVSFRRDRGNERATAPEPTRAAASTPAAAPAPAHRQPSAGAHPRNRAFSPAVLDEARRAGVPLDRLTTLHGTGRGGRISKRDVARFLAEQGGAVRPMATAGASPSTRPAPGPPPEFLYRPTPEDRVEPMSTIRKRIARHMRWWCASARMRRRKRKPT